MDKNLLSTIEAANILGISRQAVFKKIKSGEIKARKVGRNFVITRENLPYILEDHLTEDRKKEIEKAVKKAVSEYGEALRLLGRE